MVLFFNHRIREILKDCDPQLLEGIVEVDETYVGGELKNKHAKQRAKLVTNDNKTTLPVRFLAPAK